MVSRCIYCGAELIPDPLRKHWAYCPIHSKAFAEWAQHVAYLKAIEPQLRERGKPHRAQY